MCLNYGKKNYLLLRYILENIKICDVGVIFLNKALSYLLTLKLLVNCLNDLNGVVELIFGEPMIYMKQESKDFLVYKIDNPLLLNLIKRIE